MPSSLVLKLYKPFILALRPHKIEMDSGFIFIFITIEKDTNQIPSVNFTQDLQNLTLWRTLTMKFKQHDV